MERWVCIPGGFSVARYNGISLLMLKPNIAISDYKLKSVLFVFSGVAVDFPFYTQSAAYVNN